MYAVTDFASSCPLDKINMLLSRFPKTCSDVAVVTEPLVQDLKYVVQIWCYLIYSLDFNCNNTLCIKTIKQIK